MLAWGSASSGTGDSTPGGPYVGTIGAFDDENDFVDFAEELAEAVIDQDVQWFVDHSTYPCLPATACRRTETERGVYVDLLQPDSYPVMHTGDQYEASLAKILQESDIFAEDEYGSPSAALRAIGARGPTVESAVGEFQMTAIVSLVFGGSESVPPLRTLSGRTVIMFDAGFQAENDTWVIVGLSASDRFTNGPFTLRQLLDPSPPQSLTGGEVWDYWQRWPLTSP